MEPDDETAAQGAPPARDSLLHRCRRLVCHIGVEPVVFAYTMTSFVRFPVFQSLVLYKLCVLKYDSVSVCSNMTVVRHDAELKADAYAINVYSSLCLMLPSIVVSILLGVLSDSDNRRTAILVPLFGVTVSTLNDIVQASRTHWSVYWLLLTDVAFGLCGGYTAVFGTSFAYASDLAKGGGPKARSYRMAAMEAAIASGGTLGYFMSGLLLAWLGYAYTFTLLICVHVVSFIYTMLRVPCCSTDGRELRSTRYEPIGNGLAESGARRSACAWARAVATQLRDAGATVVRQRGGSRRAALLTLLGAVALEDLVFGGSTSVTFLVLNTKFGWSVRQYGFFSGSRFLLTTVAVMLLYPFLRRVLFDDASLSMLGLIAKAIGYTALTLATSGTVGYFTVVLFIFDRFIMTGMRSIMSRIVEATEQGKAFSLLGLLQGAGVLCAAPVFNALAAATTDSALPAAPFVAFAGILVLCAALTALVRYFLKREEEAHTIGHAHQDGNVEEA